MDKKDILSTKRVAAVILAAGGSTRLGQPKQLLRFEGEPLLSRVVRVAENAGHSPCLVVTGADRARVEEVVRETPGVRAVYNPAWETGMGSSIAAGVAEVGAREAACDAVVLLVCDQPLVDERLLREIVDTYRATEKKIIASEYGGAWGVPCLFDRSVFDELVSLQGAIGARSIIHRYREIGEAVSVPFPGGAFDVDIPADWQRWAEAENKNSDKAA